MPSIEKYLAANLLTQSQKGALERDYSSFRILLLYPGIYDLMLKGSLSMAHLISLPDAVKRALIRRQFVSRYRSNNVLDAKEIEDLIEVKNFIQPYLNINILTEDQACHFILCVLPLLLISDVRSWVSEDRLTVDQMFGLTDAASRALQEESIRNWVIEGRLTVDQILGLTDAASQALCIEDVRNWVIEGRLTVEQILWLTDTASHALREEIIRNWVIEGRLTVDQILGLTDAASQALCIEDVRNFVIDGRLTVDQVLGLTYGAVTAFLFREICDRVIEGRLPMEQVLGLVEMREAVDLWRDIHVINDIVVPINDIQSTHRTSVHQSVSESAARLAHRYQSKISNQANLEKNIEQIKTYVNSLSDNVERNKVAKNCITRITAPDFTYTDTRSHVSIRQLLVLIWSAIQDDTKRAGNLEDARRQLVEGLYEIQRGYNLSDTGRDQGGKDKSICTVGTFNKLIEKLASIHPDCNIAYITEQLAAAKLPIVIREETMCYLKVLASTNTAESLETFIRLMLEIEEKGVEVLWDHIRDNIIDRMFDEFGSLYQGKDDTRFKGLIDSGLYAELNLESLKQEVQNSKGYQHYCSRAIQGNFGLFSHKQAVDCIIEHRHDNPEAQQIYDKRFGLMPIK